METAILNVIPETPGEELRLESAHRAIQIHQRARMIRSIVVVIVFGITAARISLATTIGLPKAMVDTPVLYGICIFASLLSFSLEWSTRLQRQDRLEAYARYLISHQQSA